LPVRPAEVNVPANAWRQFGKHAWESVSMQSDTVAVYAVPFSVPEMKRVTVRSSGYVADHVPPATGSTLPTEIVTEPAPFTESLIEPV
jgi:hypothetical protein